MPLATVEQDRRGDITVRWCAEKLRARVRKHTGRKGSSVFLQGDAGQEFVGEHLTPAARRDVEAGWAVRVRLTDEVVAALVGGDFDVRRGAR